MLAIVCGVGAALMFATVTLCNARSSRLIGPAALLGWIMAIGLVILTPFALAGGLPARFDAAALGWMAVAGVGDLVGLLLAYAGLAAGKVSIVAPIVATQGAAAALIAAVAGDPIPDGAAPVLAVVVVGVVLAAIARDTQPDAGPHPGRGAVLAIGAAVAIGWSLYAIARVSVQLPVVWALLPSRLLGLLVVTLPLLLRSRLTLTAGALPLVVVAGAGEIIGFALFGLGSRYGIAVTAVLSSLFAAIAAVAAYLLFGERLRRIQVLGIGMVVVSVAVLSFMRAS